MEISDFPAAILSCFWTEQESAVNAAPKAIADKVADDLLPVFDATWTKEIKDNGVIVVRKTQDGKTARYQFVFNGGNITGVDFCDKDKTYVFNSQNIKKLTTGSNPKIKNYDMSADWNNWQASFDEATKWLKENRDKPFAQRFILLVCHSMFFNRGGQV